MALRNVLPTWSIRLLVLCLLAPGAARRARRVLPRPPPPRADRRVAGLGARGRVDGPARLGVAAGARASPARCRRRARRSRRGCWSSPAARSRRWPPSALAVVAGVLVARMLTRGTRPGSAGGGRRRRGGRRDRLHGDARRLGREPVRRGAAAARRAPLALPRHAADADARRARLARAGRRAGRAAAARRLRHARARRRPAGARADVAAGHGGRARQRLGGARRRRAHRRLPAARARRGRAPPRRPGRARPRSRRPAARAPTPAPARSAARSPRCGDDAAPALDAADPGRHRAAAGGGRDAAVAGAGHRGLRARGAGTGSSEEIARAERSAAAGAGGPPSRRAPRRAAARARRRRRAAGDPRHRGRDGRRRGHRARASCAPAPATTPAPRCPARARRWPSPATGPPTARRSAGSTTSSAAT